MRASLYETSAFNSGISRGSSAHLPAPVVPAPTGATPAADMPGAWQAPLRLATLSCALQPVADRLLVLTVVPVRVVGDAHPGGYVFVFRRTQTARIVQEVLRGTSDEGAQVGEHL